MNWDDFFSNIDHKIIIYTYSDLLNEVSNIINKNHIDKILFIDKNEYVNIKNHHRIYLYINSIDEKNEDIKDIKWKWAINFLKSHSIYWSNIKQRNGIIKLLNKQNQKDFSLKYSDKIEYVKSLLDDRSVTFYNEIIKCIEKGEFYNLYKYKSIYSQYFNESIKLEEDEILVDGGLYDGESALNFINSVQRCFIHCFEPNIYNFRKSFSYLKNNSNINIENLALYHIDNINTKISDDLYASSIEIPKNNKNFLICKTISLDTYFKNMKYPDIIKLDIEGSEINAINGMKNILITKKPKLQIALYHRYTDFIDIPILIKSINPKYSIFNIGYHSTFSWLDRIILYVK